MGSTHTFLGGFAPKWEDKNSLTVVFSEKVSYDLKKEELYPVSLQRVYERSARYLVLFTVSVHTDAVG